MSKSLNSLKGVILGTRVGLSQGDTRSLDYGSYELMSPLGLQWHH